MKKQIQGAVSIFLVIILVPMMMVSSMYVDASKVSLAKSVAASAGELTLNTALTDYDTKLKDLYGLFATAQDTDELYASLEGYYRKCITSAGVDEEDASNEVEKLINMLKTSEDGDTADLLNMQLTDFTAEKVQNANLANPTLLKKQIIDFMKFRSPINTGLSFITSLKSFTTLSEQTELVDKRKAYYAEEQTVMEKLKEAWTHINNYNQSAILKDNYFKDLEQALNTDITTYKDKMSTPYIKNYSEEAKYRDYSASAAQTTISGTNADGSKYSESGQWSLTVNGKREADFSQRYDYSKSNLPTVSDFESILKSFKTNDDAGYDKNNLKSCNGYNTYLSEFKKSEYNRTQALIDLNKRNVLEKYNNEVKRVYGEYQKYMCALKAAQYYDELKKDPSYIKEHPFALSTSDIVDAKIKYGSVTKTVSQWSTIMLSQLTTVMNYFQQNSSYFSTSSANAKSDFETVKTDITNNTASISKYITARKDEINTAKNDLNDAARLLGEAKELVNNQLQQAKEEWKTSASNSKLQGTSMSEQDLAEINELGSYLNSNDIDKLATRLSNIASGLEKTVTQIDTYKYGSRCLDKITNLQTFESELKTQVTIQTLSSRPIKDNELTTFAKNHFVGVQGKMDYKWTTSSDSNIKLYGQNTDKLKFYTYLYNHFNEKSSDSDEKSTKVKTEDDSNGKNLLSDIKGKANDNAGDDEKTNSDESTDSKEKNYDSDNLPSKSFNTNIFAATKVESDVDSAADSASKGLGSLFATLGEKLKDAGEDLRDNLYISDYVLNMFSFDTIDKEAEVNAQSQNNSSKSNTKAAVTSLTINPINSDNNFAYGGEVEYIIYGGENVKSNIVKAYGTIYGIRLAFNLIYAFTDSEIRETAFGVATPISAATCGIIPVPLIQAAIIIGLSLCESGVDIQYLRDGQKVPLFKDSQSWRCSIKGLVNEAKGLAGEALKTAANYGAEKLNSGISDLLDMSDEELNKLIDSGKSKIEGKLTVTFNNLITRHAETVIQKLTTLANSAIEQSLADSSIDKVEYVTDGLNKWIEEESQKVDSVNDITFIAKKEAVNAIGSNDISDILNILDNHKTDVYGKIDSCSDLLSSKMEDIRTKISNKINTSCEKIKNYKTNLINKVKVSASNGVDSLKTTINQEIDGIFGSDSKTHSDNTAISSVISFSYKDYLRLFLLISTYNDEQGVILRTADVVQEDMQKQLNNEDFLLKNSAVYVRITAQVQVKPTMRALPLFADVENNPGKSTGWYTFDYKNIKGY